MIAVGGNRVQNGFFAVRNIFVTSYLICCRYVTWCQHKLECDGFLKLSVVRLSKSIFGAFSDFSRLNW